MPFFGVIHTREEMWQEPRWWQEVFLCLHFDDRLWVNMIQGGEQLWRTNRSVVNNLVLIDLLRMGILDWLGPNVRKNVSTQAMCHSTALRLRFLERHLSSEAKVHLWWMKTVRS